MTTKAAEEHYLLDNALKWNDCPLAIHNPDNKPVDELPVIYGFNNGGSGPFLNAVLLAEDGEHMGGHACSAEGYMPHDLGCLEGARPDRHEGFKEKYPGGYRMEFVGASEVKQHEGLMAAYQANQERREKAQ